MHRPKPGERMNVKIRKNTFIRVGGTLKSVCKPPI